MTEGVPSRVQVLMAGLGGQGVLSAGLILAAAGMAQYEHVVWLPSYATRVRGGPSECTVILSHEEIDSPLLSKTQTLIIIDPPQMRLFEDRVMPEGTIVTESRGLAVDPERKDVRVLKVPALETAVALGDRRAANLVLLGAWIKATKTLPPEIIDQELERRYEGREKILAINKAAFHKGLELVASRQN